MSLCAGAGVTSASRGSARWGRFAGHGAHGLPRSQEAGGRAPQPVRAEAAEDPAEALEALLQQLGAFGVYQRYVLLMLCLPNLLAACYTLSNVFVAGEVPFRCLVPECESAATAEYADDSMTSLLPPLPCRRYMPLNDTAAAAAAGGCSRDLFHTEELVDCEQLVYASDTETIFTEFGMVCSKEWRVQLSAVRAAALPLALLLTGYISDVWGRRAALCACAGLAGVWGLLKSLAEQYRGFLALDFLETALGHGFGSAGYLLMLESAAQSLRGLCAGASGVSLALGGALLALAARRRRHWRELLRVLHGPALLLPLLTFLLHDSARWLLISGKGDKAARGIRTAARWNKVRPDEARLKILQGTATKHDMRSALHSRVLLCRFLLCCCVWAGAAVVRRGLAGNAVRLSKDQGSELVLQMAAEVAAALLLPMAVERLGRRRTALAALLLCAVACLAPYFTEWARQNRGIYLSGKLAAALTLHTLHLHTAELFPTPARASALAACTTVGHLASLLAAYTPLLKVHAQALVFGACALSAALLALALPETARRALPCDVIQAERLRGAAPAPRAPPPGVAPPPSPAHTPL